MLSLMETSTLAAVFITAILLLRRIGAKRLSVDCISILWLAALLRLVLPLDFTSPLSIYRFFQPSQPQVTMMDTLSSPAVLAANPLDFKKILGLIWLVGFSLSLAYLVFSYLRLLHICATATPYHHPHVDSILKECQLRRKVVVRTHAFATAPCTFGILRPIILLPTDFDAQDQQTLSYILSHELAHIRRWDCLKKLVLLCTRCIHWFNPLVWLMCHAANQDLERACDLSVLRELSGDQRAAYANTLLTLAQAPASHLCSAFGKTYLEERIYTIMTFKKRSLMGLFMTAAVAAATTSAFATNIPEQPKEILATPSTAAIILNDSEQSKKVELKKMDNVDFAELEASFDSANMENMQATVTQTEDGNITVKMEVVDGPSFTEEDIVSREPQEDGSVILRLKDGSEIHMMIAQEVTTESQPATEQTSNE